MDEPTQNRIRQIQEARTRAALKDYEDNILGRRYELLRILKTAGVDSASQLSAIAKIEELFGVKL